MPIAGQGPFDLPGCFGILNGRFLLLKKTRWKPRTRMFTRYFEIERPQSNNCALVGISCLCCDDQHFSTTLFSNTSLQHSSPQHSFTTLLYNTSPQHFSTTLLYNTSPQHFSTTLLLASATPASFRLSRISAKIFQELGPNSCRRFTTLISTMSSLVPFQSHFCCRIGISLPSISILTMLKVTSNGACFTPYSSTWAVFFWMYQSRYPGSIAYMILPTQQKLTLLRRVGLQNIRSTAYAASWEFPRMQKVGHSKMLSCSPRPASCFWERHPWRHFASSHLQDIILANPKPRENCGNGKVVEMVDSKWTSTRSHANAILNHPISTPAQRSPHYYSPRPCWLPNDFTSMIFLHLVNLVTRTHETDETQSISFAAASRAFLPVYERDGFWFCTSCNLSRGSERPSGKTVWTCFNRHLTHFNTIHLPKEPVNFKAKGAFMTAVSYKIMLYLYPPTYSKLLPFQTQRRHDQQDANTGATPDPNYKREPFATHPGKTGCAISTWVWKALGNHWETLSLIYFSCFFPLHWTHGANFGSLSSGGSTTWATKSLGTQGFQEWNCSNVIRSKQKTLHSWKPTAGHQISP